MNIVVTQDEMQDNIRQWENFNLTHSEREQALQDAIPFWFIRDRRIFKVDGYEANLYWTIDEDGVEEGLAFFHFQSVSTPSKDLLPIFTTEDKAKIGCQKAWKKFYDDNYQYYKKVVEDLDDFKNNNLEIFI